MPLFKRKCLCLILKQDVHAHAYIYTHSLATSFLDTCLELLLQSSGGLGKDMSGFQGCWRSPGKTRQNSYSFKHKLTKAWVGSGKNMIPSCPFPWPLFHPISWKLHISGPKRSPGINVGVPFEASNHEVGLLHLRLTVKWPHNPPILVFQTQRTANHYSQRHSQLCLQIQEQESMCNPLRKTRKSTHIVTGGAIHPEFSCVLLLIT